MSGGAVPTALLRAAGHREGRKRQVRAAAASLRRAKVHLRSRPNTMEISIRRICWFLLA